MPGENFLSQVELFQGLTSQQLDALADCSRQAAFEAGDRLHREGERADYLWLLQEGRVELRFDLPGRSTSSENTIAAIAPGAAFGWSSLVQPFKYRLSAYCVSKRCTAVRLAGSCLEELFEADPRLGLTLVTNLIQVVGTRLQELKQTAAVARPSLTRITVHLGTCGIAAGAREVMTALLAELESAGRHDIEVRRGGCLGRCPTEPNVTVEIGGQDPIVYQHMTADKMRAVFQRHILKGEVQQQWMASEA